MNTRTILFCDNSLRELLNFRGEVINYFASSGYKVILVAPKNVEAIDLASNVRFFPVRLERSGKNPIGELKYLKTLRSIYKKEKPDYVIADECDYSMYAVAYLSEKYHIPERAAR